MPPRGFGNTDSSQALGWTHNSAKLCTVTEIVQGELGLGSLSCSATCKKLAGQKLRSWGHLNLEPEKPPEKMAKADEVRTQRQEGGFLMMSLEPLAPSVPEAAPTSGLCVSSN